MSTDDASTRARPARLGPGTRELLDEILTALSLAPGDDRITGNAAHVTGMLRTLAQLGEQATDDDARTIGRLMCDTMHLAGLGQVSP